jgi:hypothetical protein
MIFIESVALCVCVVCCTVCLAQEKFLCKEEFLNSICDPKLQFSVVLHYSLGIMSIEFYFCNQAIMMRQCSVQRLLSR